MGPKKVMELEDLFESQGIKLPLDVNAIRPRYIIYLKQKVHKELEENSHFLNHIMELLVDLVLVEEV